MTTIQPVTDRHIDGLEIALAAALGRAVRVEFGGVGEDNPRSDMVQTRMTSPPPPRLTLTEFEALVQTIRPELHRYVAHRIGSAVDAEDVVQDTLLKAYDSLAVLNPRFNVRRLDRAERMLVIGGVVACRQDLSDRPIG